MKREPAPNVEKLQKKKTTAEPRKRETATEVTPTPRSTHGLLRERDEMKPAEAR